jgi:hypothetical protein
MKGYPMKLVNTFLSVLTLFVFFGCAKEPPEPVKIEAWERHQEPYFKAHFSYPKGWHMLSEGNKISFYSTPEAVEKFYDPTAKGRIGIQLMVSFEKMDPMMPLDQYMASWKSDMENSGYTIESTESKIVDSIATTQVHYKGSFDERTTLEAIRATAIKDTTLYTIYYAAFNELFAPNRFLFDSLLASVTFYRPKPTASGMEEMKPAATFTEFSNNFLSVSYPSNFETFFPSPKGGSEFSLELRGYRVDCTIHIDVLPAKGLTLEKVVEQNKKFYKSTGQGKTTIDRTSATYLNYSPAKGIESRVYFLLKNDKVYRMIFNIFQPMKKDYLPAFEKTIASVRVK